MQQLSELSELDTYWRNLAFTICGCPLLADDLVQDMYLKIYERNPPKWNKRYVYRTIHNLFIDELRRTKKQTTLDYIEVSTDPTDSDCIELLMQKALDSLDADTAKATMINMDYTVRSSAVKMGYSAYKLWSRVKAAKEELSEREDLKEAYKQLKNGEI